MKTDDKPCTRRELLTTIFSEFAAAGVSVISDYTEPFCAAARAAKPAGRLPVAAPGALPSASFARPPGAVAENRFLELCARCGACARACPAWVIRKAGPESGSGLEGSPVLRPAEAPCLFCEGLPCAAACGTGALVPPPAGVVPRIGLAAVDAERCYAGRGQPCDLCFKKCPAGGRAISVIHGGPALVDPAACTGCGVCAQGCPAGAISIKGIRC